MTKYEPPDEFFPAALRKIFNEKLNGPLELSVKELKEARAWKRKLDLDIAEIDHQLSEN